MPRRTSADVFTAVRGWVTEITETNWPQDAAIDLDNVEITNEGEVRRRRGLEVEAGVYSFPNAGTASDICNVFLWKAAGGISSLDMVVIQSGEKLYFYANGYPLLANYKGMVSMAPLSISNNTNQPTWYGKNATTFARCDKWLFCANPGTKPFYIELDANGNNPTAHEIALTMRVFEHFSEHPPGTRPNTLTHTHEFDLRNGGWPWRAICAKDAKGSGTEGNDPVKAASAGMAAFDFSNGIPDTFEELLQFIHDFFEGDGLTSRWPATSDNFYAFKAVAAEEPEVLDAFSPWAIGKHPLTTDIGSSGKFITSVWDLDTLDLMLTDSYNQGGGPIIQDSTITRTTSERPTAVGAVNGHVFWATKDYNGVYNLAMSQLMTNIENAGKCYQAADPTAEEVNDLVATDGAMLPIPGLGQVIRMEPVGDVLYLLAVNGVWLVAGGTGDGSGVSATSIKVSKVSDYGCTSATSVAVLNTTITYLGRSGIYAITLDQFGTPSVQSMTQSTIQSYFDTIPLALHSSIVASSDPTLNRIEWVIPNWKDGSSNTSTILVFNANTQGFFKHTVRTDVTRLQAPIEPYTVTLVDTQGDVVASGDNVVTSTGLQVVATTPQETVVGVERRFRYLSRDVSNPSLPKLWVSNMADTSYVDFSQDGGTEDAAAFIEWPYRYPQPRAAGMTVEYMSVFTKLGEAAPPAPTCTLTVLSGASFEPETHYQPVILGYYPEG